MRAPFSVRMHFSKLALRTRKGQPTTWPRRGGGRKKRFVAPFLTSYWSLRCSAGARPSTHLLSVRHLPRPPSRSLVQMHDGPKQFDPCCKARRHPHGIGLLTITAMTAVIAGDLHGECGPRGVGNRGTTDFESDNARGTAVVAASAWTTRRSGTIEANPSEPDPSTIDRNCPRKQTQNEAGKMRRPLLRPSQGWPSKNGRVHLFIAAIASATLRPRASAGRVIRPLPA